MKNEAPPTSPVADPGLGEAALPAASAAELLRRNAADPTIADRPAIRFDDRIVTHAEYYRESCRWANLMLASRRPDRPLHVAILLDNIPEYLFAFGGAALAGGAVVGVNHTRRGEHLAHDVHHTHCVLMITEPAHEELIAPVVDELGEVLVVGRSLEDALGAQPDTDPYAEAGLEMPWALIFTSGTSAAPKAVICSQRRILVTGSRMGQMMGLGPDDIGYVSMPLFHSNAVMVGWAPSVVFGASVGLARRFTASGWLADIRRYGATYFNYTGKPLAYILAQPERPDDADNTLRVAYGNEGAPAVVEAFAERFGVRVIDGFGATEGGLAVTRIEGAPPGSVGRAGPELRIVDADGRELPRAEFDESGALVDPVACVGEIVNTSGTGVFEGYYNNDEANAAGHPERVVLERRPRLPRRRGLPLLRRTERRLDPGGRRELPDRPHRDDRGTPPRCDAVRRLRGTRPRGGRPGDGRARPAPGGDLRPGVLRRRLDAEADLSPKWRPAHVRISAAIPTSPTNKVLSRTLVHQKYRPDRVGGDPLWVRTRGDAAYRPFGDAEAEELHRQLDEHGRLRFWDL